ncbi:hypothetical protein EMIHUDRAFT_449704, partial [Emiliania huxleyi CCMP1516]
REHRREQRAAHGRGGVVRGALLPRLLARRPRGGAPPAGGHRGGTGGAASAGPLALQAARGVPLRQVVPLQALVLAAPRRGGGAQPQLLLRGRELPAWPPVARRPRPACPAQRRRLDGKPDAAHRRRERGRRGQRRWRRRRRRRRRRLPRDGRDARWSRRAGATAPQRPAAAAGVQVRQVRRGGPLHQRVPAEHLPQVRRPRPHRNQLHRIPQRDGRVGPADEAAVRRRRPRAV